MIEYTFVVRNLLNYSISQTYCAFTAKRAVEDVQEALKSVCRQDL